MCGKERENVITMYFVSNAEKQLRDLRVCLDKSYSALYEELWHTTSPAVVCVCVCVQDKHTYENKASNALYVSIHTETD